MIFKCPKCGGSNKLELAENEFIKCSYCNSFSYIDIDGIVSVYTFKSLIDIGDTTLSLKKDFEKIGFSEEFRIVNRYPLYIPFWDVESNKALLKGSSQYRESDTIRPSEEKIIFDFDSISGSIDIIEPDIIPEEEEKKNSLLYPFL